MFTGIIAFKPEDMNKVTCQEQAFIDALAPFHKPDKSGSYRDEHCFITQALTFNTPESKYEETPYICSDSGLVIVSWGSLHNRTSLLKSLKLDSNADPKLITDPMLMLTSYQQEGKKCVDLFEGDFSFLIIDTVKKQLFAGRDSVGIKPFYYYSCDSFFVFSTSAAIYPLLKDSVPLPLTPSTQWIAQFILRDSTSYTRTAFNEVYRLAPAHTLELSYGVTEPAIQIKRYTQFIDDSPKVSKQNQHCVEAYKAVLDQANIERLRSDYLIGSENSGGIDSSTCVAYAAKYANQSIDEFYTYSFARCEHEADYIEANNQHCGIKKNIVITEAKMQTQIDWDREIAVLGYPVEHSNASFHMPFYEHCQQHNIRTLLSGFGGDEVVTNPGDIAKRELLVNRQWIALFQGLGGEHVGWLKKTVRFLRVVKDVCSLKEYNPAFLKSNQLAWQNHILKQEVIKRYDLETIFKARAKFDAPYTNLNTLILDNRLLPFVPTRTEQCSLMAASYGVEYRWPLLDRRLMQQYLSTPVVEKWWQQMGRLLHRKAIDGLVAPKVGWKPSKDMGNVLNSKLIENLSDKVASAKLLLDDLHPVLLDIIDVPCFRDQLARANQTAAQNDVDFLLQFNLFQKIINVARLNCWLNQVFPNAGRAEA